MAKKKKVPEQLVLGAKLHCPLAVGDVCSYLWVDTKILDINHVPPANVDDCVAMHNIMSFGNCNAGGGTCDVCMKFDSPWKNREPQGILVDGKEAINMESILVCSHGPGVPIDIKSSGQDHLFVSQIIFMKEMDLKYPGLRKILEDPGGSLYLNDGMYQMALQFLEDRINADGGAVSLYILDDKDNPEAYYIKSALGHLEPAVNVTSLQTYVDGFNAVMGRYDGSVRATIDDHSLNGAMLDLLKRDCAENNRLIQAGGFYKWQEEHKGDLVLLADWMRGAVDCSMMAASMISSGPGASVNSVEGEGWSEEVENVKVEGDSGTGNPYSHLEDPPNVGPGNDFTQSQKNQIIQENMKRNNGVVKSDMSGQELVKPQKSQKGVTPPQNEWQIDHITPKDKGGSNSFDNAQVLSREENRTKSNK